MSIIRVTVAQQSCTPKSKQAAREGTFHITINYAKDMSIQVQTDIFVYTFAMAESHGNTGKSVGASDNNLDRCSKENHDNINSGDPWVSSIVEQNISPSLTRVSLTYHCLFICFKIQLKVSKEM
jgi:hypothetical protein